MTTSTAVAAAPTRVRTSTLRVSGSLPGAEGILPAFSPLRALPSSELGGDAPAEMRERAAYGRLDSPLPYPLQSDYARDDEPVDLAAIELTNGLLTATVLPGLGGRVWSLHDHVRDRELLHVAPLLRFANFGLTDAWFAGGIEWNLGSTGHSCLSSRPMHAAVLRGVDGGDVLRLWEWERTRDLVLQVDLSLEGDRLVASTRVVNPDAEEKPLYYWTNIAVPETAGTRVLCPATHAWRTDYTGGLRRVGVPFPDSADVDISRPLASSHAADYFYDVAEQRGRHLVAVEADGSGFSQTSTAALTGRKLFLWGSGAGGARWQSWLSGPDARYCEIQAGVCPTQLEHTRLAGHDSIAWTESFGAVDLPPSTLEAEYDDACATAAAGLGSAVDAVALERRHERWVREVADTPPDEVVATGSGWGFAELLLRDGTGIGPGVPFPEVDDASAAAVALVRGDAAGLDRHADRLPVPPVSERWAEALRDGPDHWWAHYARAVGHHRRGDLAGAETSYRRSIEGRASPGALRGLALVAVADRRVDEALEWYERARALAPGSRALVTEELALLLRDDRPAECLDVVGGLPHGVRTHGRTRLLEAQALVRLGRADEAAVILADLEVDDLAEGELALGDLWSQVHPGRSLPPRLDFRMVDEGSEP